MIKHYMGLLQQEFRHYSKGKLQKDLLAGLTVAAVALPLALAFGVSSGADAAAGMITAIIAGVVIGSLSGGFYQISGPTGAMAAILTGIIASQGLAGVLVATFIAGIILLIAGLFKLGGLTSFIPSPVITGFTSGIAIIIALGQIDNFFGTTSAGESALAKLMSYRHAFTPDFPTLLLGLFVLSLLIFYPKKWSQILPPSLVAIILATLVTIVFNLPVAKVGKIPTSLLTSERLHLATLNLPLIKQLLFPAVSIAMLGMIESLLCGAAAGRMTGKELDSNQELIAQGIGNMILPFFGGIPATAAIARTSVAIKSGAQTRLAGIFHALFLFLSMIIFAPIMSQIPMTALAGVLLVTSWRMHEWTTIKTMIQQKNLTAILLFFVTMLSTIIFDLSIAIVIGVLFGCVFFISKSAKISIITESIDWQRMGMSHSDVGSNWVVIYITGPLFFMSSNQLKRELDKAVDKEGIIFSLRGVPSIDLTARDIFADYFSTAAINNQKLIFTSMQPEVEKQFNQLWDEQTDCPDQHPTVAHALHALHQDY
ncbi:SulP family inorganic anion transporter [Candidatus Enterococcus murrayae]|uniref:SulP family inorganic anion transporter n=1 Tax=Candidatus Enterococcus murrayae TaxID=2815321 RepID=A0ABS3HF56_9ENTE|nr:SulP family inorganic anion transporter [Enterococcus sp. MJM16]MBO0452090.1 SulP family inorganic anion transporter [Enterococcus sp. MJM16]